MTRSHYLFSDSADLLLIFSDLLFFFLSATDFRDHHLDLISYKLWDLKSQSLSSGYHLLHFQLTCSSAPSNTVFVTSWGHSTPCLHQPPSPLFSLSNLNFMAHHFPSFSSLAPPPHPPSLLWGEIPARLPQLSSNNWTLLEKNSLTGQATFTLNLCFPSSNELLAFYLSLFSHPRLVSAATTLALRHPCWQIQTCFSPYLIRPLNGIYGLGHPSRHPLLSLAFILGPLSGCSFTLSLDASSLQYEHLQSFVLGLQLFSDALTQLTQPLPWFDLPSACPWLQNLLFSAQFWVLDS